MAEEANHQLEMSGTRRPHFLHVFSPDSSSERLWLNAYQFDCMIELPAIAPDFNPIAPKNYSLQKIPVKFLRHMEGRTSGWVSLLGPSGNTWHVELTHEDDNLFFSRGWISFLRDHLIEYGDFLVFRYNGECHFTVQMFDQSGCEKEAVFYSKCSQDDDNLERHAGQKRGRDNLTSLWDKVFEAVSKKSRETCSGFDSDCVNNSRETDAVISAIFPPSESQNDKRDLEEKEVAAAFTSSFPYFVRTMKRFNVSGSYTLNVPYKFLTEHFPNCKTEIVLRNLKGVCWTVNSVPTTRVHTSHTFCGGWLAFVRSNDIKTGDICIFELVRKSELLVHICRVGKEKLENQGVKGISNGLDVLSNATSRKMLEGMAKKSIKNSEKVNSKSPKNVYVSDKKGSKAQSKRKHGNTRKNSSKVPRSEIKQPENDMGSLRLMIALDEQKAARSFTSAFPNFVRIMRKFNISGSYTLKIPHQFSMAHLPDSKTEIVLRNSRGDSWIVNSVPDSKGRTVHTFCGGWMAFVRDNYIQMGDICIFELISKCEMQVHISRFGMKFMDHQQGRSAGEISVVSASGF